MSKVDRESFGLWYCFVRLRIQVFLLHTEVSLIVLRLSFPSFSTILNRWLVFFSKQKRRLETYHVRWLYTLMREGYAPSLSMNHLDERVFEWAIWIHSLYHSQTWYVMPAVLVDHKYSQLSIFNCELSLVSFHTLSYFYYEQDCNKSFLMHASALDTRFAQL